MGAKLDLTGETFGRLTVVSPAEKKDGRTAWRCVCSCGKEVVVSTHSLRSENTRSCGCLMRDTTISMNISRTGTETFAFDDLTGVRFGRLVAVCRDGHKGNRIVWKCLCDCGNYKNVIAPNLTNGSTSSCGCLKKELLSERNKTSAMRNAYKHRTGSRKLFTKEQLVLKAVLRTMIDRCHNPKSPVYKNYGGRGITVCDSWRNSFESFYADMSEGYTHGLTIDRINNDLGYCKENCRWATPLEQAHNKRK